MQFLPVLVLLIAGAFAAPVDFQDIEDGFNLPETTAPETAPTAEETAPVAEPETPVEPAPEAPAEPEVAPEAPAVPETPAEEPVAPVEETPETPVETPTEPEETPEIETPVVPEAEPETPAVVETPAEEPVVAPVEEPVVAPAEPTEAPVAETENGAEKTEEGSTDDDDEDSDEDSSDSSEPSVEKEPVEIPAVPEPEPVQPAASESATDAPVPEVVLPVEASNTLTGAAATVNGVTIRFALQATWLVSAAKRRGYVVKIENKSDKAVCGVTFSNNSATTDAWNLTLNEDGSFTTKDLHLAPGTSANQFGYVSSERTRPTIISIEYC